MSSAVGQNPVPAAAMSGNKSVAKVMFLLDLADRFEAAGNVTEAIKSLETAVLLRKSLSKTDSQSSAFEKQLWKQAQDLVNKCNSTAVSLFQVNDFDSAMFILNKALFLTEESSQTNCFEEHAHDRIRLRAATFNNLGCLEKRRNQLDKSLSYLQNAIELEVQVDADIGASPSTNLNICTVMNKMGMHAQAVVAAERAIAGLKFQVQHGQEHLPQFVNMLVMAYYNLGVSLEYAARPGDIAQASEAYMACMDTARRYSVDHQNHTVDNAQAAVHRLQSMQGGLLVPLPSASRSPSNMGQVSTTVARPFGESPMPASFTPQPPATRGLVQRGTLLGSTLRSTSSTKNGKLSAKLGDAATKHAERIQARQRRKEEMRERDQVALRRAQRAHVREKEEKLKKEKEMEAQRRDELAKTLYDKMVTGLRAEEIKRVKTAAKKIQKMWRGYLVRDYKNLLTRSTIKIQSVVRSWLCRLHIKRETMRKREEAKNKALQKQRNEAAVKIQSRVRLFLYRMSLIRDFKSKNLRRHHTAKKIQKQFRNYRARMEQRIIDRIELERKADEVRVGRLDQAAKKIQNMYRAFKSRRFMRVVKLEQIRRNAASTKIQAHMRGALTREWFKHYQLYRRQQELSSATNIRAIISIQRVWRGAITRTRRRRTLLETRLQARNEKLFVSARRIQCCFRCFAARKKVIPLRNRVQQRQVAARIIQRIWNVYLVRKAYIWRRNEVRKKKAIFQIQLWWRDLQLQRKHQESARYHAEIRRKELIATIKTAAAITIQSMLRKRLSSLITESMRGDFIKKAIVVSRLQRVGRSYLVQCDMSALKRVSWLVHEQEKRSAQMNDAARTIQRPVRMYLAKVEADNRRRRRAAALIVQKTWRMFMAKKELWALKKKESDRMALISVVKIQRSVKLFLKRQELKRLDAYYAERHRKKMLSMRRDEAAIGIQAVWRGYSTRQETTLERQRLLQHTIDAIRIQRAWRAHAFRSSINKEIRRRVDEKTFVYRAAVKIQSFWRGVLALEYALMLRERRFTSTVCAITIQCAWRRHEAIKERERRRVARLQRQTLAAHHHDLCVRSCDLVTGVMKTILAQKNRLVALEAMYMSILSERDRGKFIRQRNAATLIQANYRGHYERVYARGLRREKEERDRIERERKEKERRAASAIQRGVRCSWAREETNKRRVAKRIEIEEQQADQQAKADPQDVVKQMFWSHEAIVKVDITKERKERHVRSEKAATRIQSVVRMHLATCRVKKLRVNRMRQNSAALIQQEFRRHKQVVETEQHEIRTRCATKIQSIGRMFIVRLNWKRRKAELAKLRSAAVDVAEKQDQAATTIQSSWRRGMAIDLANKIRTRKELEKQTQTLFEAARLIQKHFRGFAGRKRAAEVRKHRVPYPNAPKAAAPPPGKRNSVKPAPRKY